MLSGTPGNPENPDVTGVPEDPENSDKNLAIRPPSKFLFICDKQEFNAHFVRVENSE